MKSRSAERRILTALRENSVDVLADDLPAETTIEVRCAQLEDENRRLKLLVADLTLRNEALRQAATKKW